MIAPALAWLVLGCGRGDKPGAGDSSPPTKDDSSPPAATETCAAATVSAAPGMGDANLDGAVDISDGIWALRAQLAGGSAPACTAALDLIQDGTVDITDGLAVWYHLFAGNTALPRSVDGDCSAPTAPAEAACGAMQIAINAPERVTEASFEAEVRVLSRDLDLDAWSLAVAATGCTVTAAEVVGPALARSLSTDGVRESGYEHTALLSGGAMTAVALSWRAAITLPASAEPVAVWRLQVSAPLPTSGCAPCTLTPTDGLQGQGEPVTNTLTHGGRSYHPPLVGAAVEVCAG